GPPYGRAPWRSDANLAALYGVPTKAVVQALKRTPERFPDGFLFLLSSVRAPRRSGVSFGQSSVEGREHPTHGGDPRRRSAAPGFAEARTAGDPRGEEHEAGAECGGAEPMPPHHHQRRHRDLRPH